MRPIRGVLLDIDGVLHVSMQPLPGAVEALSWLERQGYATYFVSNTTTMARATLARRLQQIGLPVAEQRIITAPVAAAQYIRQHFSGKRCWLLTKGDTAMDFTGINLVKQDQQADVVVIGGAEELLTYQAMNQAFRSLMAGATLLALHKNLYWKTQDGLQLDSGPFVRALEIASGKEAIVLGKPTAAFFEQALRAIGCEASATIMVGDDIENDVGGAQKAGLRGILVCTGKHKADSLLLAHVQPEAILPALADLPQWLQHQGS
ncbi:TIGR01458 family HAD-type hydrolase [Dictyobacter kobayashii]|uniref:Haloacid dehalogenase-like hydrolase domain-containing protein 2 n=1 Tax=Dictyobacter kobayashii TaxID=2014872 RepID=A0A402APF2_9CHLR|nr:TIGR01458 family HAD-type hydrolase [Dictyobacter kobayashii]GCE21071.1 haloacid dehalogenase [Dictyobacter kobayashii]